MNVSGINNTKAVFAVDRKEISASEIPIVSIAAKDVFKAYSSIEKMEDLVIYPLKFGIPVISISTKDVFKELDEKNFPENLAYPLKMEDFVAYPLKEKMKVLTHLNKKMEYVKEYATRHKIFAILRSALTIAVIVGGVLGTMAMTSHTLAAIGIGLATATIYTILAYYNTNHLRLNDLSRTSPIRAWVSAPFFPIIEEFCRVFKIKQKFLSQLAEIESFSLSLIFFFKKDLSELEEILTEEIKKANQSLDILYALPLRTEAGEAEIEEKVAKYKIALKELQEAIVYYTQF